MAAVELPCDGDGVCMVCQAAPPEAEVVLCSTCTTPWHAPCLARPLPDLAAVLNWQCPDCSPTDAVAATAPAGVCSELIASIRAIEADKKLTETEKARLRQALLGGRCAMPSADEEEEERGSKRKRKENAADDVLHILDEKFNCAFCMQLPERPITTPCGHNFCLKCFQKWVGQGKHSCAKCRAPIPSKMATQPRINSALVEAIRMARTAKSSMSNGITQVYHFVRNEDKPDKAFTTERAKRAGKANACSGQIFVTVAPDHFGPIMAENDPKRNRGVLVGDIWEDRMECRQWGAHLPHVAGIAGQSDYGAQSVALSGGYEDDEDHGEWFLYTGSGGRDLSGNKRTNKEQAFDQKFEKLNEALRVSCKKGYPLRVVRSHKEKQSSYAPESGVRYDGIYRIEKCWRKVGIQGFKVCRYLFVRCDNAPAPWTSDEHGDRPRPLPDIKELKKATDVTERKESPAWDYDEEKGWRWMKDPPLSRKQVTTADPEERKRARIAIRQAQNLSVKERLLKEFSCLICRKVMTSPLTTPCAHNFCKSCLLGSYADRSFVRERTREGGRTLRAQKIVKKCPCCPMDISDFLQNPQINRELNELIESLKRKTDEEGSEKEVEKSNEEESDDLEEKKVNGGGDIMDYKTWSAEESVSAKGKLTAVEESYSCKDEKPGSVNGASKAKPENSEMEGGGQNGETETSLPLSSKRKNTAVGGPPKKGKNCKELDDDDAEDQKLSNGESDHTHKNEDRNQRKPIGRPNKSEGVDNVMEQKSEGVLDANKLEGEAGNTNGNHVISEMEAGAKKDNQNTVNRAKPRSRKRLAKKTRNGNKSQGADTDEDDSPSSSVHVPTDDDDFQ